MTASSFTRFPGLPILHSRDLVNSRLIAHARPTFPDSAFDVPQHGNGVWAPSIRHHNGRYYIYWGAAILVELPQHVRRPARFSDQGDGRIRHTGRGRTLTLASMLPSPGISEPPPARVRLFARAAGNLITAYVWRHRQAARTTVFREHAPGRFPDEAIEQLADERVAESPTQTNRAARVWRLPGRRSARGARPYWSQLRAARAPRVRRHRTGLLSRDLAHGDGP